MIEADFVLRNCDELVTCAGPAPRRGPAQADAGVIPRGALAAREGRIVFAGPTAACDDLVKVTGTDPAAGAALRAAGIAETTIGCYDLAGFTVVPGFVDPHTHAVFAGDRRGELRRRLAGATYAAIAAEGGGILSTVAATRGAALERLVDESRPRLAEMRRCGTTICEIKSGYGLTVESELRILEALGRLAGDGRLAIVPTFMGAHEVPPDYRGRRDAYVGLVIDEMIPAVARQGIARWCDVFCEDGVFSVDECRAILRAAQAAGLGARVHADELGPSGGARLAADVGARSADHLVYVTDEAAHAMAAAGTTATLLPAAAFFLKLGRYAPARMLIDSGVPVALATDVNPGGGFSPSMPFVMTLACYAMGLTLEEALVASTLNAAYALDCHEAAGSIEVGKRMDAVVVRGPVTELLRPGAAHPAAVLRAAAAERSPTHASR